MIAIIHYNGKYEDDIKIRGNTIEELRKTAHEETSKRGWKEEHCWSEVLSRKRGSMTREEREIAIQELEDGRDGYSEYISTETFNRAIEALKREPSTDAISREAVIDEFDKWVDSREKYYEHPVEFARSLISLPPVTPERPNVNDVLDKIRAEIEQLHHHPILDFINNDKVVDMALEIIDKYKTESEE